ncbi:hypothetical protein Ancab_026345 [Ancistrocladus abbreviatus]
MNLDSSDKPQRARPVLSDVANQLEKRGFALVSRSPASKSWGRNVSKRVDRDKGRDFVKQVSLGKENSVVGRNIGANVRTTANEVGLCPLRGGKAYRLQSHANVVKDESKMSILRTVPETKRQRSVVEEVVQRCDVLPSVAELGDNSRENGYSSVSVGEAGGKSQDEERIGTSGAALGDSANEAVVSQVEVSDGKNLGVSSQSYSISASVVGPRLTEFQHTKSFELERCTTLKGDGSSSWSSSFDSLKGCSCSFCMKAAYIWSDLHYQDINGRLSALMKSQKEANNLAQRFCGENEIGRKGQENSNQSSKLETDLMNMWKSLFLRTEEMFVKESSQLENSYLGLKDMRENFRMDLDMTKGVPSEVQQCFSDPSADKNI